MESLESKQIREALEIAFNFSQIDGSHHKAWTIDQMVRKLIGNEYNDWVAKHNDGADGPNTYEWDIRVAP